MNVPAQWEPSSDPRIDKGKVFIVISRTTPKNVPAPLRAQNKSGWECAFALMVSPVAVTSFIEVSWSQAYPWVAVRMLVPPLRT